MELKQELKLKQTLSQKMIQSANILQMGQIELKEYIEEMALENPVVDLEEREPENGRPRTSLTACSGLPPPNTTCGASAESSIRLGASASGYRLGSGSVPCAMNSASDTTIPRDG